MYTCVFACMRVCVSVCLCVCHGVSMSMSMSVCLVCVCIYKQYTGMGHPKDYVTADESVSALRVASEQLLADLRTT